jgi:hypothetical protein
MEHNCPAFFATVLPLAHSRSSSRNLQSPQSDVLREILHHEPQEDGRVPIQSLYFRADLAFMGNATRKPTPSWRDLFWPRCPRGRGGQKWTRVWVFISHQSGIRTPIYWYIPRRGEGEASSGWELKTAEHNMANQKTPLLMVPHPRKIYIDMDISVDAPFVSVWTARKRADRT